MTESHVTGSIPRRVPCSYTDAPQTCPLNRLGLGCRGFVAIVGGDGDTRRRLLEMGFCNGTCVEAIRRAPMGDPIQFRLRGYCLSLRDAQAELVHVIVGDPKANGWNDQVTTC
jgi:ferrous iron transport protein A